MTTIYLLPLGSNRFPTGQLLATLGIVGSGINFAPYLQRHLAADWGDVDEHDRQANDQALVVGERLFSAYNTPGGRIWIITEADRSATTILLPEEY